MPQRTAAGPRAPLVVERFVKQLYITYKAVRLYPPSSNIPRENAAAALAILRLHFRQQPEMRLFVTKDALVYETTQVFAGNPSYAAFAREFYNRRLSEVRFHSGVRDSEVTAFLALLLLPPEELSASGGFEARLWDRQVDNITVKTVAASVVAALRPSEPAGAEAEEEWPPVATRIDEMLASGPLGPDHRLLVRVVEEPEVVGEYLRDSLLGRGDGPDEAGVAAKISSLAHLVAGEIPDEQSHLFRSLLEGVLGLPEPARGRVLRDRLLPEARGDDAIADMLRHAGLDELAGVLVEGLVAGDAPRDAGARALRGLITLGLGERDEVLDAVGRALESRGVDAEGVSGLLAEIAPTTLQVRERPPSAEEAPADTIGRLFDLNRLGPEAVENDPAFARLAEEAREGITDGHVLGALVDIMSVEQREAPFHSVMSLIEDGLELLLERGDFEIAADVAAALVAVESDSTLDEGRRTRVGNALKKLANPDQMRLVNEALRLYRNGTPEHDSCRRLLSILGAHAVGPLLEVLAEEPDMTARKALVDVLAAIADRFVDDFGARVTDSRWYFVRNVVGILANVRDARVLPYLERTLRYPDPRVRRETIRAVAGVRGPVAHEMLVAALEDEDAQNVQLASRYLGSMRAKEGVDALVRVARGEGRGNREPAVRVEAIESLGRIGSPEVVEVLEELSRRRSILGRGVTRELRAAAEAALRALRAEGVAE